MNEAAASPEYFQIRKTAEEYRARGYDVAVAPGLDFLPGYRPDLVVRKGDESRVIEVKTRASLAASPRLKELVQIVDSKPGWSFELILVAEPEKLDSPEGAQPFERDAILHQFEETERILASGFIAPAFLHAWSACEAAIRMLIAEEGVSSSAITSTGYVFNQAVFLGIISQDDYRTLTEFQRYRNAIVHGYSHDELGRESVAALLEIGRGMTLAAA